jgi:hypothetical protein
MKKLFETASNTERKSEQVDKIAKAARALRWSERIVEAKRAQMQSITKMQMQMMYHVMDAREEQIKLPNLKTVSPLALLSQLKSHCGALVCPAVGRTRRLFQMAAINALEFGFNLRRSHGGTSWAKSGNPHERIERRRP